MEGNDFTFAGVSTTSTITKSTSEIAKIVSSELIKQYELNEYCNFIESDLKKWYEKLDTLNTAKDESVKIVAEYKSKNKTNAINSDSLFQALNELQKYKSELKSTYISTEKALKVRKLKYKKIISSYESSWQKSLNEYNADPVFVELTKMQEENELLEREIEKQEKVNESTETQLTDLKENLKKAFREKIVEFSKVMLQYKRYISSTKPKRESESQTKNRKRNIQFKLFTALPENKQTDNTDDSNYMYSIDVSVFDDLTVPSENLESQNLEEDSTLADVSKEQEPSEYLNNYPQTIQYNTTVKDQMENTTQVDDNESHYFRAQPSETSKQPQTEPAEQWNRSKENFNKHLDNSGENLKSVNNTVGLRKEDNGEESSRDMQMECDESVSDGSYEKQMSNQRGDEYHKTSSFSSEDLPPSGEVANDSPEPVRKKSEDSSKPDFEKNDFKAFTGFFTMGNDMDTSKPSIFKLF